MKNSREESESFGQDRKREREKEREQEFLVSFLLLPMREKQREGRRETEREFWEKTEKKMRELNWDGWVCFIEFWTVKIIPF
jgi:hypothetical protein